MVWDFDRQLKKYCIPLTVFSLIVTIGVLNWEGVKDGDFFWQMQYGKYILENKTLITDHTIYSWTPATNKFIYCSWIAQVVLYLIYFIGGLPFAFLFQYLCVICMTLSVWLVAHRFGKGRDILTICVLIVLVISTRSAAYLKPEIFSMVLLALVGGLYFLIKAGIWRSHAFYYFPLLLLIWVNTHGVFTIGLILIACIALGELINFIFKFKSAFSWTDLKHLILASFISLVATLINPYGIAYHHSLVVNLFSEITKYRMATISAHGDPFNPMAAGLHLKLYWLIMLVSLSIVLLMNIWRKRSLDWGVIIPNVFLAYMFTTYIRTSFLWSAFWGLSLIYLNRDVKLWEGTITLKTFRQCLTLGFVCISIFAAGQAVWEHHYKGRMVFEIGYMNAPTESAFLKQHKVGTKLYNSYNLGGYLLWDLYPTYKIFCDPRSFPYEEWYKEYYNFNNGDTPLEEFQKKFDFDVAMVDYISSYSPIIKFLQSRQWTPVYFGPIAMIFVRNDVNFRRDFRGDDPRRFDQVKNLEYLYCIFGISVSLGDMDVSAHIIDLMKNNFNFMFENYELYTRNAEMIQQGVIAYDKQDFSLAWNRLKDIAGVEEFTRLKFIMLDLRNRKAKECIQSGRLREALELLETTLAVNPLYIDGLYNAGIIGYQVEMLEKEARSADHINGADNIGVNFKRVIEGTDEEPIWKVNLKLFLRLAPSHKYAFIAKRVLEGFGLPPTVELML